MNRSARTWIGIAAAAVAIAAALYVRLSRESPLVSDPLAPRSWAGGALTRAPIASSDSPREPWFSATYSPLLATPGGWETTIELPRVDFVPAYEMVEGNAADGFQAADFRGRVKCLAASFFAPDPSGNYDIPELDVFHPDGTPMTKDGQAAAGIGRDDLQLTCGWQEGMTSMLASVELEGCENPQVRNRGFLDADTGVVWQSNFNATSRDDGFCISGMIPVLHDASVTAVVDIAHGPTRDAIVPLRTGETVDDPAFRLEILGTTPGNVCGSSSRTVVPKTITRTYQSPFADPAPTFSVFYRIDPPIMEAAVSVEALDAEGNPMEGLGPFMDLLPVSRFKGDLAHAASLRVRCRPGHTRLLLRLGPVPCAKPGNRAPENLFDVRAPDIAFRDSYHMRQFICDTTELMMLEGSHDDTDAGFPIAMTSPSPREVAERYRMLPGNRRVEVDPAGMTVRFERPAGVSFWDKITGWLDRHGLMP